eukprot:1158485-Pelagomonas_calceolata.AAC.2
MLGYVFAFAGRREFAVHLQWYTAMTASSTSCPLKVHRHKRNLRVVFIARPCCKRKGKKNDVGSEKFPTSTKEERIPRAEAPCIPSTKRKKEGTWGQGDLLAVTHA